MIRHWMGSGVLLAVTLGMASHAWGQESPPAPQDANAPSAIPIEGDSILMDAAPAMDAGPGANAAAPTPPPSGISGNPAASNVTPGTGDLGRLIGVDDLGIRLGGVWIFDENACLTGGLRPGDWVNQNLFILDGTVDLEKMLQWKGAKFGIEFLTHHGQQAGQLFGDVFGVDSLDGGPPSNRSELYELWFLQKFLDDKVSVRIGKQIPTYDFANIADVTGLIMLPIFVMPTVLGRFPGYPDSATGVSIKASPTKNLYAQFGFYDGRLGGSGVPTGLLGPQFNGQYFYIGEAGLLYRLGDNELEGKMAVGGWRQTGVLTNFDGGAQDGTAGFYAFAKQQIWREQPGVDAQGVDGFFQFGLGDPNVQVVQQYYGAGLRYLGVLPRRDLDSAGFGVGFGHLTNEPGAAALYPYPTGTLQSQEIMFQWYYQCAITNNFFAQPTLTYIVDPGTNTNIPNALGLTLRIGLLF